jgi:LacI family transcriptional regulator
MKLKKRVTIGQLAKELGVSAATVSRALKDNPMISQAVREQVQQLAKRRGYRPDPEAARLMTYLKRSDNRPFESVIGLLNGFSPPEALRNDVYTRQLLEGARQRAAELGFSVDELQLGSEGMTSGRIDQIIAARGIRGVLIPPEPNPLFDAQLNWASIIAVATTTTANPLNLHRVLPHNFYNLEMLMQALVDRSFKRVGLLYWDKLEQRQMWAATSVYARYAFLEAKVEPLPPFQWHWREDDGLRRQRLAAWMQRTQPEIVLGFNRYCLDLLQEVSGLRVPEDLGFASYGDCDAGLAGIDQYPKRVGAAAIDLLSAHVQRSETGLPQHPKTTLIEGCFVEGTTLGR